jgi:SlyX protein
MDSVDLEEKVAHLIRAVEDLSDVVARQATEIAGLERRVRLLMERAAEEEALGGAPRTRTSARLTGEGCPRWTGWGPQRIPRG